MNRLRPAIHVVLVAVVMCTFSHAKDQGMEASVIDAFPNGPFASTWEQYSTRHVWLLGKSEAEPLTEAQERRAQGDPLSGETCPRTSKRAQCYRRSTRSAGVGDDVAGPVGSASGRGKD